MAVHKAKIMMVTDNDEGFCQRIRLLVEPQGYDFHKISITQDLLRVLRDNHPKLVIIASSISSRWDGIDAISRIRENYPVLPLVFVAARSSEDQAIAAFRAGVTDYVKCACSDDELLLSIRHSLELPRGVHCRCNQPTPEEESINQYLIGESLAIREIKEYLRTAAHTDANVLITGETGTGKERVAQLIHRYSQRRGRRLISINCAALPESLLESDLFGYEKGAFTGANTSYEGKLKLADGGTVFFDEIGDMGLVGQAKILRAIESKEIFRLGGKKEISLDFRVVAATNQDLEGLIVHGMFRKDLYYRLNVARIHVPPLRERKEDIPVLISHFLQELNSAFGADVVGVQDRAMQLLVHYRWPGNIRELRNILESAFINHPSQMIQISHLPKSFRGLTIEHDATRPRDEQERDEVICNGQQKPDTFLRHFPIKFSLKFQRGLVAQF